jgi:hypothetical protein
MVRVEVVNELHMDVWGDGVPALFVHGSFGWGLETFPDQRALADQYQVVLIDRCGFGGSASREAEGWPVDMDDVAALLDDVGPAHVAASHTERWSCYSRPFLSEPGICRGFRQADDGTRTHDLLHGKA